MRFAIGCLAVTLVLITLPSLRGAEKSKDASEKTVAQQLAEMKEVVAKLSVQIEALQQQLDQEREAEQVPLVIKSYVVREIVPQIKADFAVAYDFDHMIHYITTKVAPEQWKTGGGQGSITAYPQNHSLIISQTHEVHEEIREHLTRLREAKSVVDELHRNKPPARTRIEKKVR